MVSFFMVVGMTAPLTVLSFVVGMLIANLDHEVNDELGAQKEDPNWISII